MENKPEHAITCEPGWTPHDENCYRKLDQKASWEDSEKECVSSKSHLASIKTRSQQEFVQSRINPKKKEYTLWIGLKRNEAGEFRNWIDGSPIHYSNWRKREPNNQNGNEHCVGMERSNGYTWNDMPW